MADISIATIVLPYYLKRDNRLYISGVVQSVLDMGNAVRFNGNGGSDSPVNIDDDMVLMYLPSREFYGLTMKLPTPTEEQKLQAYKIALQTFPNMKSWDQADQDLILASVFSIYGYGGSLSDVVLVYKGEHKQHRLDRHLYQSTIKLAKAAGVKIKYITSR